MSRRHSQLDLLDWKPGESRLDTVVDLDERLEPSIGSGHPRRGKAGHYLVMADLLIREWDAWEVGALDCDVIGKTNGKYWEFQVKSSENGESFGCPSGGSSGYGRDLTTYKVHGFAFVNLTRRLVYYVHVNAVTTKTFRMAQSHWSQQQCELSFVECMRRFNTREVPRWAP